ncbi:MAG: tRNA threonylcarbamoyladenosine dehydratase [Desulfotignum sp.]|nr:tRNA threonylcarbamoyladenosine dehydratase [Desulfotignum sp.]MCF8089699.1 tRNA threonylcarbamoyladenosine dehydratase [Desulfotignum sp.]
MPDMTQFDRTARLMGKQAVVKLGHARMAVFGLGAVGSFAVEALARAGVGYLRLVDFDRVDMSNINRQLYALHSTLGEKKADIARARVQDIYPACEVDICDTFVNADSLDTLLSPDLDVVVDAIDGLNSKVNLLVAAREMDLGVVSSMGAGGRKDVSQIRTGDISDTQVCPLARVVRRRLHRRGVFTGIRCVYSLEPPILSPESPVLPEQEAQDPENSAGHGRQRPPMGTIPWIPGIFGLTLAAEAVQIITG